MLPMKRIRDDLEDEDNESKRFRFDDDSPAKMNSVIRMMQTLDPETQARVVLDFDLYGTLDFKF